MLGGDVIGRVRTATMSEARRGPGRVFVFLREQAGAAFCIECLANALAVPRDEVRMHVTEAAEAPKSSIEASRGRCSVCRVEHLVARYRRGA